MGNYGDTVRSKSRLSKDSSGESEVTTRPPQCSSGTDTLTVSGVGAGVACERNVTEVSGSERGASSVVQQLVQTMAAAQTRAMSAQPNISL